MFLAGSLRAISAIIACLVFVTACSVPHKGRVPARSYVGRTRVACIGDSITAGAGIADPRESSYPAVLGKLLGSAYEVRNFGVNGATMLKDGELPYTGSQAYAMALDFQPDVVVILLGTNDSKPQNWRFGEAFERDTYTLIRSFLYLPSRPKVYICTPPPVFQDRWGITSSVVSNEIVPILRRISAREFWPLIDLHRALLYRPEQFPDGVHPDATGAASIASSIEAGFRGR